jgi:hypothetical protein
MAVCVLVRRATQDDEEGGSIEVIARRLVREDQDRVVATQHTGQCEEVGKYEEGLLEVDFHFRLDSFRSIRAFRLREAEFRVHSDGGITASPSVKGRRGACQARDCADEARR